MKYKFENYTLDTERRELRCNGIIQSVEPQVLDLLHFLIKNCDRVVSREGNRDAVPFRWPLRQRKKLCFAMNMMPGRILHWVGHFQ
jgi:hypothetical protein